MNFKDFPQAVVKENVDWATREITNVIKRYGPRESGGENCYAAQKHLKKEMDTFCDETGFESYKMAPKAFIHFTKTVSVAIFLAFVVCLILVYTNVFAGFFIPQIIVGVVVAISLCITFFEFVLYKQMTDVFYKKIEAHNFYAKRKPQGEIKRRLVIEGHIDAAYEWRHIYYSKVLKLKHLMVGLIYPTIISAVLSFVVAVVTIIASFVDMGAFGDFMFDYSYYFHAFTALMMVTLFLFCDFKTISPGANDNLTGTYAAVCALRMLDMAGVELENTELVAMITDGEEAGLRGATAWAKAHKDEYLNDGVETAVLCVDTLADIDDFYVYTNDMSGTIKNNKQWSNQVLEAGKESGAEELKFSTIYFGASDSAAFTKEGIASTCLAAMDPTPADYYHNRRDNADRLSKDAMTKGFNIILSTILDFDKNGIK